MVWNAWPMTVSGMVSPERMKAVSYTHLTLPTKLEV